MAFMDLLKKASDAVNKFSQEAERKVTEAIESNKKTNTAETATVQPAAAQATTEAQAASAKKVTAPGKRAQSATDAGVHAHFSQILHASFDGAYIIQENIAPMILSAGAHPACKPIDFLFYGDGKPVLAVMVYKSNNSNGMNAVGTRAVLNTLGIPEVKFFEEYDNKAEYVTERIHKLGGI